MCINALIGLNSAMCTNLAITLKITAIMHARSQTCQNLARYLISV